MIKQILLRNFQIHKKLSLELTDGFNCITGSNQRGKSSIVRAVYWFLNNAPAGDWMCRRDADGKVHTAIVKFVMDNGDVLKRVKGGGRNYYALNDQEFNDIGRKIPAEITGALNIGNDTIKELGLNLSIEMQEDMPFLVHETSTVKSGALNVLTGVNTIEKTIKEFNRDRLAESRRIGFLEETMGAKAEELARYDDLAEIDFDRCDVLAAEIKRLMIEVDVLNKLIEQYREKMLVIKSYECLKDAVKDFAVVEQLIVDVKAGYGMLDWLRTVGKRVKTYQKFTLVPPFDFDGTARVLGELTDLQADLGRLRTIKQRVWQATQSREANKRIISQMAKEMIGKICPTCGSVVKKVCHVQ